VKRILSGLAAGFALVTAISPSAGLAQSAGQWQGPQHIWNASCAYCHGTTHAPELLGREVSAEVVRRFIRQGAPGMPAFHSSEISDQELDALAEWIETSKTPSKPNPNR
jgi:mono/diheme cytochrome c family protein